MYTAQLAYGSHDARNSQSSFAIVYRANYYYLHNAPHNPVSCHMYIYICVCVRYVYCSAQMLLLIMILHDVNTIIVLYSHVYPYT